MPEEVKEKTNWLVPTAIGVGAIGVGLGVYLYLKKGPGVPAGGTIIAKFSFDYTGRGGTFIIQLSLGVISVLFRTFDHIEGMTWQKTISLPGPGHYTENLECPLPMGVKSGVYDAEALIRTPDMSLLQYIVKSVVARAVTVVAS